MSYRGKGLVLAPPLFKWGYWIDFELNSHHSSMVNWAAIQSLTCTDIIRSCTRIEYKLEIMITFNGTSVMYHASRMQHQKENARLIAVDCFK